MRRPSVRIKLTKTVLPDLILMMRLYWPKDEAVNGAWVPPPADRMD
jgi:hypothetical protein